MKIKEKATTVMEDLWWLIKDYFKTEWLHKRLRLKSKRPLDVDSLSIMEGAGGRLRRRFALQFIHWTTHWTASYHPERLLYMWQLIELNISQEFWEKSKLEMFETTLFRLQMEYDTWVTQIPSSSSLSLRESESKSASPAPDNLSFPNKSEEGEEQNSFVPPLPPHI